MSGLLQPHPVGIPVPSPTALTQPYWDGCAIGELRCQVCDSCGRAQFDPLSSCRHCRGTSLSWQAGSGRGRVYSWTTIWRPPTPAFEIPYVVAIIDMDEGYQMIANVIDCKPDEIVMDMSVSVSFAPIGDGVSLPYFSPSERRHDEGEGS